VSFDLTKFENISVLDELSLWDAPFGLQLLDTIRMRDVKTILDVGSGLGFPSIELAMRFGPGTEVFALDPWEAAVARAKWKAEIAGLQNYHTVAGTAEAIPFPENHFDLIVSNNGLNNVQDMLKSMQECRRVAKKNAQFVFTMNTEESLVEFYSVFRHVLTQNKMASELRALEQHIHDKRKPIRVVDLLIEEAGWNEQQKIKGSFKFRYASGSAMFAHFFIQVAFMEPWRKILPEAQQTKIFDEIEQRLNVISQERGELVMTIPFVTYECIPYPF